MLSIVPCLERKKLNPNFGPPLDGGENTISEES